MFCKLSLAFYEVSFVFYKLNFICRVILALCDFKLTFYVSLAFCKLILSSCEFSLVFEGLNFITRLSLCSTSLILCTELSSHSAGSSTNEVLQSFQIASHWNFVRHLTWFLRVLGNSSSEFESILCQKPLLL